MKWFLLLFLEMEQQQLQPDPPNYQQPPNYETIVQHLMQLQ